MKATLTIQMDNAAFDPCPGIELARILEQAARWVKEIYGGAHSLNLKDHNGNTVGSLTIEED